MESEVILSIHTATYNRGYIIEKAYNSLKKQTCYNFEWVVTDDGSDDNTEKLFENWCQNEKEFPIYYNNIGRSGIPKALNYGVNHVHGKYFFMLDSDDTLEPNAVEKILEWIKEIDEVEEIAAVGFAIGNPDREYLKGSAPYIDEKLGYIDCSNLERPLYNMNVDMREVYKVDIMKKYPFKVWEGEIYAPEQICFNEIALAGYKIRWRRDILYIADYLDDGQTKGGQRLMKHNPMGYAMMYDHMLKYGYGVKRDLYNAIQMNAMAVFGRNPGYFLQCNNKKLGFISWPLGILVAMRRYMQLKDI